MTPHRDLSSPVPFGRSLRASRERRAAADRRRRRLVRGRAGALLTGLALTGLGGVAAAQDGIVAGGASPTTPGGEAASTTAPTVDVRALQRRLGVPVDGVMGSRTRRAIKRFQRRHGLVPDGIVGPRTRRALGLPAVRRATRPAATGPAADAAAPQPDAGADRPVRVRGRPDRRLRRRPVPRQVPVRPRHLAHARRLRRPRCRSGG